METQNPSPAAEARLLELAIAIADGTAVDWTAADSPAIGSPRDLARLQHVERMVRGHTALRTQLWSHDTTPARDTLFTEARRSGRVDPSETLRVRWGPLVVHEKIGRGSFGDVYRAWDPRLERAVALKLIPEHSSSASESPVEEGRLLARVRHPNVLTVHGAERIDGRIGIWTEYVSGETLAAEVRRRGPLPVAEAVAIGVDVCRALGAVHAAGLLHRDVKAQNVFRDGGGRIILGDFGTGIEFADDTQVGAPQIAGTPLYLAPEIFQSAPATRASDLYGVGVLLYFLLTGDYPVRGATFADIRRAHESGDRRSLAATRPDCPSPIQAAIERALATDPLQRFETPAMLEAALIEAQQQGVETAAATETARTTDRSRPRSRQMSIRASVLAFGGAATAIAAMTAAGAMLWRTPVSPRQPLPTPLASAATRPSSEPSDGIASDVVSTSTDRSLVTLRRIDTNMEGGVGVNLRTIGDDSRLATCTPGGAAAVAVCNLTTGEVRLLRAPKSGERSPQAILSPDGQKVAYTWTDLTGTSLRVIGVDAKGDRELYRHNRALMKWIQGGRALLLSVPLDTDTNGIRYIVVPVDGGEAEEIWQFDRLQGNVDLSPDGRYIVFSRRAPGQAAGDLAIIDRQSGRESWLLPHPANDSWPLWAPNGRSVVFLSDRTGTTSVFELRVSDGRPADPAARFVDHLRRRTVTSFQFARDGTLFVGMIVSWTDAFRAAVDLEAGVIGAPVKLAGRSIDDTASPDWSPDGGRIAYLSGWISGPPDAKASVVVRDVNGGERLLPLGSAMGRVDSLRWLPDSQRLVVRHDAVDGPGRALDLLDTERDTGVPQRLLGGLTGPLDSHLTANGDPSVVFYSDGKQILRHDIASGTSTPVFNGRGTSVFDVSPRDGSIAVGLPSERGCILTIQQAGGQIFERHTFDSECRAITWSHDGSKLLVSIAMPVTAPAQLWVLDALEGEPVRLKVPQESIRTLSLRPDDRELLFTAGNPWPEFWTLRGVGVGASVNDRAKKR